jgi:hypothetical protein
MIQNCLVFLCTCRSAFLRIFEKNENTLVFLCMCRKAIHRIFEKIYEYLLSKKPPVEGEEEDKLEIQLVAGSPTKQLSAEGLPGDQEAAEKESEAAAVTKEGELPGTDDLEKELKESPPGTKEGDAETEGAELGVIAEEGEKPVPEGGLQELTTETEEPDTFTDITQV